MPKAYIKALASYVPEKVLTNFDFEKILDTNNEWIVTRTGIERRHIAREDETIFEMSMNAIKNLKEMNNLDLSDVDAIMVPTVTEDYIMPSTAGLIQNALGLKNCLTFDIMAACSGYVYSLNTAAALIESEEAKNVLVVTAEKLSKDVNWTDRGTAILFGDAASAFLVSATDDDRGVISMDMKSVARPDLINLKATGSAYPITPERMDNHEHKIYMEGSEVFKLAVTEFTNSIDIVLKKAGVALEQINFFVPHQANLRIIQSVAKKIGVAMERIELVLKEYGNTSCTSIGLGLSEAVNKGKVKKGDYVLIAAFGAGLTWGSTLIKW